MNVQMLEYATLFRYLLKWCLLATLLGLITGSACALFLWLLDVVTEFTIRSCLAPWVVARCRCCCRHRVLAVRENRRKW